MTFKDISQEAYGKYQYCTKHWGLWYSDDDFLAGRGCGPLKWGARPDPSGPDTRPWFGIMVELVRRAFGAPRNH